MRKAATIAALLLLAVFAASPSILLKIVYHTDEIFSGVTSVFFSNHEDGRLPTNINFVGDIMLGRHVETLIEEHGADYPLSRLREDEDAVWVGNFEAVVPNEHIQTADFDLQLSVNKEFVTPLYDFGFRYFNLANNHTYDFAETGLNETRANLSQFELFGDPNTVGPLSVTQILIEDKYIGVIGVNAVDYKLNKDELFAVLNKLQPVSDWQVAYIHWGSEYELTHSKAQEILAEQLIDQGIDLIVGHHPHVVQGVGWYKNKPIFYSLGNFIFDQYFSEEVQKGLIVSLSVTEKESMQLDLLPVTSIDSPGAPKLMTGSKKEGFLEELSQRSSPIIGTEIQAANLIITD